MGFEICEKGILYLLITFQTTLHITLTYQRGLPINTTYTFDINLVYEIDGHQNQGFVTLKLAPINLVAQRGTLKQTKKKQGTQDN